jgi:hypothetical protein
MPRDQTLTENCTIHNYNVVPTPDRYLLVSGNHQSGISVVDFTDPENAEEIAFADPAPLVHPTNPETGDSARRELVGLLVQGADLRLQHPARAGDLEPAGEGENADAHSPEPPDPGVHIPQGMSDRNRK